MTTEPQKYRAYTFNIAGFALISPSGRIFFEPVALFKECGPILFFVYIIISLGLALLGLILLLKGYDILDLEERKIK